MSPVLFAKFLDKIASILEILCTNCSIVGIGFTSLNLYVNIVGAPFCIDLIYKTLLVVSIATDKLDDTGILFNSASLSIIYTVPCGCGNNLLVFKTGLIGV